MTAAFFRSTLFEKVPEKPQTLSLKLDLQTLVEFAVAAKVLRARSLSGHIHQFVVSQINEARRLVTDDEWNRLVAAQRSVTLARSREKSKLRARNEQPVNGNVEPLADNQRAAYVRHIGELTDETAKHKQKPIRKKAGR
jgi:hypothetical protein